MFDTILLTTDGSDLATAACEQGIELAEKFDSTIHVLYAAGIPDEASWQQADEEWRKRGYDVVDPIVSRASDRGLEVRASVKSGRPLVEILEFAGNEEVELITCGTHGRTGIRKLISGSVASGVIRDSTVPVLSVSSKAIDVPREIDTILLAVDGRVGARSAVTHALQMAMVLEADVHALSVVDPAATSVSSVLEAFEDVARNAVEEVESRGSNRGITVTTAVEHGEPHDTIVTYAENADADLTVMGTESRSGLDRLVFGSCSQRVVSRAPSPVLTVRSID